MRAEHYVYFALKSDCVPAADITARLGIEPDKVSVRGSRLADPPRPACHVWAVECRTPGLTIDEQIDHLLQRLLPSADLIGELAQELDRVDQCEGSAVLQVVRSYQDNDPTAPDAINLLGWHLDNQVIDFLARTHAALDVDEYDLTQET